MEKECSNRIQCSKATHNQLCTSFLVARLLKNSYITGFKISRNTYLRYSDSSFHVTVMANAFHDPYKNGAVHKFEEVLLELLSSAVLSFVLRPM